MEEHADDRRESIMERIRSKVDALRDHARKLGQGRINYCSVGRYYDEKPGGIWKNQLDYCIGRIRYSYNCSNSRSYTNRIAVGCEISSNKLERKLYGETDRKTTGYTT